MHRFGLDGMLQGYGGNCKHLQNRSPSSLHAKQHKLTKSQGVVLYFYNASLGQHKKWIICAGRHCNLTNHDCAQIWLQNPGPTGDPLFIKFISRFGLELCCHPSGRYEDCFETKALPVPDSTLQLYQWPKSEQEWQVVSFNPNATATAIEQPPAAFGPGIAQEWCVRSPNRRTNYTI